VLVLWFLWGWLDVFVDDCFLKSVFLFVCTFFDNACSSCGWGGVGDVFARVVFGGLE
jgi:hypothetical protein